MDRGGLIGGAGGGAGEERAKNYASRRELCPVKKGSGGSENWGLNHQHAVLTEEHHTTLLR